MAELDRTAASLRFGDDDLDPDEITRGLGMAPSTGVRKGGTLHTPKGSEIIARTGMWHLTVPSRQPGNLDDQIRELLAGLTDDLAVWCDFSRRYRGNIFAGLFVARSNEGLDLNPGTLLALGARGLALGLDIYKLDDPDEDLR